MREFTGKAPDGSMQGREIFRNVTNGQVAAPAEGWNGEPPYPTGDLPNCRHISMRYRENFDQIRWNQ